MKIGMSSSCFYPENIEDGFKKVGELGTKTAELFVNSPCEMQSPIINELLAIQKNYGINIRTVHPFTSAFETFFFFSAYDRRRYDGIEFYKRYFEAANRFGAEAVVFHGGLSKSDTDVEFYAQCYSLLHNAAREQGIFIAHENVVDHMCSSPEYMKNLADYIGDDFRMVLDIKQCRRSGEDEYKFIKLLGDKIIQVHISDYDIGKDCLAPGIGKYDFAKLFFELKNAGYDKTALIELYRHNFSEPEEIQTAMNYLNTNCL